MSELAEADPGRVVAVAPTAAGERRLTARALDAASHRYARRLLEHGVRRENLVTVTLPNGLDMIVVCAAVWKAGATPQPVSPGLTPAERADVVAVARRSPTPRRSPTRSAGCSPVQVLREDGAAAAPGETGQVWLRRGTEAACR